MAEAESEPDVKVFTSGVAAAGSSTVVVNTTGGLECVLDYYDLRDKRKIMLIFNHFKYRRSTYRQRLPAERPGTAQDVKRLRATFQDLGFQVEDHHDLTYDEIMEEIYALSKRDHEGSACVALVVLTHGEGGGVLLAADRSYDARDLWTPLRGDLCPQLADKPKLFFIQACRGSEMDPGVEVDSCEPTSLRMPTTAHFLLMYSTVEDFVSWRDAGGSWFIQALCQVLQQHGRRLELLQLLTLVSRLVASSRASRTLDPRSNQMRQMPQLVSTLTSLLKF